MIDLGKVLQDVFEDSVIVSGLAEIKSFSEELYKHSMNVCLVSIKLAKEYFDDYDRMTCLAKSALLHDIGKLRLPKDLLETKEMLRDDDLNLLRLHSLYSAEWALIHMNDRRIAANIIMLHEAANSKGYPFSLNSAGLSLESRIINLVNYKDVSECEYKYGHESIYDTEGSVNEDMNNLFK